MSLRLGKLKKPLTKQVSFALREDQFPLVEKFMIDHEIDAPSDAMRALVDIAFSAIPQEGFDRSIMLRSYYEVRHWAVAEFHKKIKELDSQLEQIRSVMPPPPR